MTRALPAVLWGGAALAVFGLSAAPGMVWADSAKLTLYALHSYLPSFNPGDHAGWTVVARMWLALTWFLPAAYALNLLSAVSGAVVVGGVHRLLSRWGESSQTAHGAAAVLLASHPLWWAAAVAESYAPALALVVAGALLLRRGTARSRFSAGVCCGLAVAAHAFAAVLIVPLVAASRRRGWVALAAGAVLGAAPMWLAVFGTPRDPLTGFASGGLTSWSWHVAAFLSPTRLLVGLSAVACAVGAAVGPLGVRGAIRRVASGGVSRHPSPRLAAAALCVLAAVLTVYSPYRLHLMAAFLVVGAVLIVPPALTLRWCLVHVALQVALYGGAAAAAHLWGHEDLGVRELPGRHNARYFLWPPKTGEASAERYARELLAALPQGAVVLADFNQGAVLRLAQVVGKVRPDVDVIPTAVDDALATPNAAATLSERIAGYRGGGREVVLADDWPPYYRLEELRAMGYAFSPCGPGLLVRTNPLAQ